MISAVLMSCVLSLRVRCIGMCKLCSSFSETLLSLFRARCVWHNGVCCMLVLYCVLVTVTRHETRVEALELAACCQFCVYCSTRAMCMMPRQRRCDCRPHSLRVIARGDQR